MANPRLHRARQIAVLVGLTAVGLPLPLALMIDRYGRQQRTHGVYDAIVVAGCRVLRNGQPSPALERRVRLAVDHWRARRAPQIVLTGGIGDNPPSEAAAAAVLAQGLGVPRSVLIVESASTSTRENAQFTWRLLPARRILLVTDSYHVYRARRDFQRYFPAVDAVGALAPWPSRIAGALREVMVIGFYQLRALLAPGRA